MFRAEREQLVEVLISKGIKDKQVLRAIYTVKRHEFVNKAIQHNAYKDFALPIGNKQTISQPYTVAFMTQSLQLEKGDKVLEVGTGSGYQACILEEMGMKVFSIERQYELYIQTRDLLDKMGRRVNLRYGDGSIGWSEYAPYNGIVVTAGGPKIPQALKNQLAVGGRMVIPVGGREGQTMTILHKTGDDEFDITEIPDFEFVPLIGREGWED